MRIRPLEEIEEFKRKNIISKISIDRWLRVTLAASRKSPVDVTSQLETVAKLVTRSNFDDVHSNRIARCLILGQFSRRNFKIL